MINIKNHSLIIWQWDPLSAVCSPSEFKPVKLRLKIDLVSYPARAEGLGKYGLFSPGLTN